MEKLKLVASVQDISCLGKCSLTVALPVISACGVECSIIPTAVLSTHTGGFEGFTYCDLTAEMEKIYTHWQTLPRKFDALYTGFLGKDQIDIVCDFFSKFKTPDNIILVDPAMADNGVMYSIFDEAFARDMKKVCEKADIIIPNITEACFLTGTEYFTDIDNKEKIEHLVSKLLEIAPCVVLTGVVAGEGMLGACVATRGGEISYHQNQKIDGHFHGTGDLFASTFLASHLRGKSLACATQIAVDFVYESILETKNQANEAKYGPAFELAIPKLIEMIKKS
ncbi:MAG: pyridoxamine kinase [Bacillota bacterium]